MKWQHVDYFGDKFIGYVDYGSDIGTDTTKLAKKALVFYGIHKSINR